MLVVSRVTDRAVCASSLGLVWIVPALVDSELKQSVGYVVKPHDVLMNSMLVFSRAEIRLMEDVKKSIIMRIF